MNKINEKELNLEELNKNVEMLLSMEEYFKSIGGFCVHLWTGSGTEVGIQADDNSILAEYIIKNGKSTLRANDKFDIYSLINGNLKLSYLKEKPTNIVD